MGFTLIEMVVTLLVMVLLTTVALRSATGLQDQARYEQTRDRLEMIREAILGDPRKSVNGQAVISGFVADMGRLPVSVRELLQRFGDCDNDNYDYSQLDCQNNGGTWTLGWFDGTAWRSGSCSNTAFVDEIPCRNNNGIWAPVGHGWRGPYLQTTQNPNSSFALTDGWGREAQGLCSDARITVQANCLAPAIWMPAANDFNYGWWLGQINPYFNPPPQDNTRLVAMSYGADGNWGGTNNYQLEYPPITLPPAAVTYPKPLVDRDDWMFDLTRGITVSLLKKPDPAEFCGFTSGQAGTFTTQQTCENAGGTWAGGVCSINVSSCKPVGGLWQSCFFTPANCASAGVAAGGTGGTSKAQCHFSKKSCDAAGGAGSWDGANNLCKVNTTQANCTNAGGTWNVGTNSCDFTEGKCALAGGKWFNDCTFTQPNCLAAGGTWDNNAPNSCSFTLASCNTANGQSNGSDCYMSHADSYGARYTPSTCSVANGNWTGRVCMNIYYRDPGIVNPPSTMTIIRSWSGPYNINAGGGNETITFNNFRDVAGNIFLPNAIPMGNAAIGIYEWDGNNCNPLATPIYPAGHALLSVDFHPQSGIPALNW